MLSIKHILVPVDWSSPSLRAFDLAASLAADYDAELIVLYVVPLPTLMYGPPPENYLDHMREELARLKPPDWTIGVRYLLSEGMSARAISKVARETSCDLIVIGTHGRNGMRHLLLGSVAEEVVRGAPCPVLTVKAETSAELTESSSKSEPRTPARSEATP